MGGPLSGQVGHLPRLRRGDLGGERLGDDLEYHVPHRDCLAAGAVGGRGLRSPTLPIFPPGNRRTRAQATRHARSVSPVIAAPALRHLAVQPPKAPRARAHNRMHMHTNTENGARTRTLAGTRATPRVPRKYGHAQPARQAHVAGRRTPHLIADTRAKRWATRELPPAIGDQHSAGPPATQPA